MNLLTDDLRQRIGERRTYVAPEPIGRAAIRYFATVVGDPNPLSRDLDAARSAGFDDLVAPPTFICETNQYAGLPMDDEGYAGHTWNFDIPGTRQIRGGNAYRFHQPAVATDIVTAEWRIEDITERTSSAGTQMLIVSSIAEYRNQHGADLATNTETIIFQELSP